MDLVWAGDRPARPASQIFPLPTKYSGESAQEKTGRLRQELAKRKVHAMVITMLDEVAWLFNLRGADIEFNPGMWPRVTTCANQLSILRSLLCVRHCDPGQRYALRQSRAN